MRKCSPLNVAQTWETAVKPFGKRRVQGTKQVFFARVLFPDWFTGPSLCRGLRLARYHRSLRASYLDATAGCEGIGGHTRSCGANSSAPRRTPLREPLPAAPPLRVRIDPSTQHATPWSAL